METESTDKKATREKNGCFVSVVTGFILLLLALVLVVVVAIIVYFASGNRNVECHCNFSAPGKPDSKLEPCRNTSIEKIPPSITDHDNDTPTTATTTTKKIPGRPTDVRLPLAVIPIEYNIELRPDIYGGNPENFISSGKVEIVLQCRQLSNVITLHINKLTIDNTSVELQPADQGDKAPTYIGIEEDTERQFLKVHLNGTLALGKKYILRMRFEGPIDDNLFGAYWSSYRQNNETKYLLVTQFEPTEARTVFPCFDEPDVKATFRLTLHRKPTFIALSNMLVVRNEILSDGWVADHFQQSVKMPTYLVAFVICEFIYKEKTTRNGIPFRVWSRPDAIEQTTYSLDLGVKVLDYYEDYFNISYPLPKLDMIAIPDLWAPAMENWGLITYRETTLLYEPGVSSIADQQLVALQVSHEIVHMWFGDIVTPSWWDDIWLNEGFARNMEYIGANHVHPEWKLLEQVILDIQYYAFTFDGLGTSHPVFVPVVHPEEILEIFDFISYYKGAAVIRMMNFFLGEMTFRKGLTKYLQRHVYSNTHHTDLWNALEEQAKEDGQGDLNISAIMNTWLLQMGYPVVTITRTGNTVLATQQHFLLNPDQPPSSDKYPSPFNYSWIIPLTYTASDDPNWESPSLKWMHMNGDTLPGISHDVDWLIANIKQQGFYRVNYDANNWQALIQQLKNDHTKITVMNRAQIIDDAFNLGRSGLIEQEIGLEAIEYLAKEREYVPWKAASTNLVYIHSMLEHTAIYGPYQKFVGNLVRPVYNIFGWNYNTADPAPDKFLHVVILDLACLYKVGDCRRRSWDLYRQFMNDSKNGILNRIQPELRSIVYCNAVLHGGHDEWEFAYDLYKSTNVGAEKIKLLNAMACTTEPWLLKRYLQISLNKNEIRKQDVKDAWSYIAKNPIGRNLVWDFLRKEWDHLKETSGIAYAMQETLAVLSDRFNSEFELQQVTDFMNSKDNIGSLANAFHKAFEKIRVNIKWMKDNAKDIEAWLMGRVTK